jgi:hypothetical protein
MTTEKVVLDAVSEQVLLDIFRRSLVEDGGVDAISYQVEHEDSLDQLKALEQRQLLKRDKESYRVSFIVLTLLDDPAANAMLQKCEKVFGILRQHYKDPATRSSGKRLQSLADELDITYPELLQVMRHFIDSSGIWCGGWSNDWSDAATACVHPSHSIIEVKTFANLVEKVEGWHAPQGSPTSSAFAGIGVDFSSATKIKTGRELFFPNGEEHSAYVDLRAIIQSAKSSIYIIDPYVDSSIFLMLKTSQAKLAKVNLLTTVAPVDFKHELSKFQKEVPHTTTMVRTCNTFHDRFIVIDDSTCFHIGASIKDAGKKAFLISQLEDPFIVTSLLKF